MNGNRKIARRTLLTSALAGSTAFALGALGGRPSARGRPNIIVIVSDALRADMLRETVGSTTVMPNVAELALAGTTFTTCVAPSSWTLLSVPGYLSSRAPLPNSPVIDASTAYFPDSAVNIAGIFSATGMLSAAVVQNPWLYKISHLPSSRQKLYARGFEIYHNPSREYVDSPLYETLGGAKLVPAYQHAGPATDIVLDTLEQKRAVEDDRPFFLYVHYMDTHEPYFPPKEFREKFLRSAPITGVPDNRLTGAIRIMSRERDEKVLVESDMPILQRAREMYVASANYVDFQVGRIVEYLRRRRLLDNSIIVFTADHGEEFGERGWIGHSRTLYSEVLHVPLVMAAPGVPRGATVSNVVSSLDIAPALLELSKVHPDTSAFEGQAQSILGSGASRDIVSTTKYPPGENPPRYIATALTSRTAKRYIRTSHLDPDGGVLSQSHEMYDLAKDPREENDLAPANVSLCASHSDLVDALCAARSAQAGMTVEIPDELRDQLRALGYLN